MNPPPSTLLLVTALGCSLPSAATAFPRPSCAPRTSSCVAREAGVALAGSVLGALFGGRLRTAGAAAGASPWEATALEVSLAPTARTFDLSRASLAAGPELSPWTGGRGDGTALGQRFGLGRETYLGGTLRLRALLFGGNVSLGGRLGAFGQVSRNGPAALGDGQVWASRGWLLEGGVDLHAVLPLRAVTLRAGVFAGYRAVGFAVQGATLAEGERAPSLHREAVTVAPEVEVDLNLTHTLSVGAAVSVDAVTWDDYQAGLTLAWHAGAFSGR